MAEIREAGRSGTKTNWTFSWTNEIGNTGCHVSYILNENYADEPEMPNQAGTFIEQLTADDLPRGVDGEKVPHPTMENVYVGFDNYALSEGRVRLSAEWSEGEITSDQADAYANWLRTENFGLDIENIQQTSTSISWEQITHDETGGPYSLIKYQPNSQFKVTIVSDVISMVCFLRPENMADVWNTCSYSIRAGESLTINKQGTECWLAYVGHDFVADGTSVAMGDVNEMTSNTIEITNNSSGVRKVGMLWKQIWYQIACRISTTNIGYGYERRRAHI